MAFQIKDFASICASILNHARSGTKKITDWLPGSVARTLVEAPAVEIEELYLQMFIGLKEAMEVSTFRSFDFDKRPAAYARGFVSVSVATTLSQPIAVPIGTSFTASDGRQYKSTELVTWQISQSSVRIPVIAAQAGSLYNIAAGGISQSSFFGAGFTISNSQIDSGLDIESDDQQKSRFADYVASLSRGTVIAGRSVLAQQYLSDSAGTITEYVTRIGIKEDPGYVRFYIFSSSGVPSTALLNQSQQVVDGTINPTTGEIVEGIRAGGIRWDVLPMAARAVPFTCAIGFQQGYSLTTSMRQQLTDAYASVLTNTPSGSVLYVGAIETALLDVVGILTVVPSVTSNIVCGEYETLIAGTLTLNTI